MPGSLGVVIRHPAVWSVPLMAVLVIAAMPVNDGFYEFWINYDPQGDGQQWEWGYTDHVYRHTSGVLCGQVLSLLTGYLLARRHRQPVALAVAVTLGAVLAVVTVAVAVPLAGGEHPSGLPVGVIAAELVAYPLFATAGVGLGTLIRPPGRVLTAAIVIVAGIGWLVMTVAGLIQDDRMGVPVWLLWLLPPLAASSALGQATLSLSVFTEPIRPAGDWGDQATGALLAGLTVWTVVLNLLGARRRAAG
ncbi:hypothetical protein AB0F81_48620 [Actinoplanes sp. NPDC024001]|uniref:hypothetical protein n=1 Tax=Actinoplanes sp. NPDC024001 TaxID=3154598 RepID=UPI0033EDD4CC